MNLLFSMSLAGSLVLLLYLVIRPAARHCLPAVWHYRLLKAALLFFLLPYQYVKYICRAIGISLLPGRQIDLKMDNSHNIAHIHRLILVDSNGHFYFENHVLILILLGVWAILAAVYLIYHLVKYVDCTKDLQQLIKLLINLPDTADEYCSMPGKLAGARVSLYTSQHITTPFTVGLLFSRIILPASLINRKECRMIISHELEHVKNHDNLIKFLCLLAIFLHWYNPLIYILYREICKISEQVCDAAVIRNMSDEEIEQYKLLIIELSKREPNINVLWASPFNGKFKMMKERMIVMNKTTRFSKGMHIAASMMMAVLLLVLSPISVLAYSPTPTCEYQDQQIIIENDFLCFASGQTDSQDIYDPFLEHGAEYDIFIDNNGQSYVLTDSDSQIGRILCIHDWVDGKLYSHGKHDDGSCILYCYNAQMCTICNSLRHVTLYCEYKYTKCPH